MAIVRVLHHREIPVQSKDVRCTSLEIKLRLVILLTDGRRFPAGLRLVPLAIQLRQRVDVVRGLILIHDLQFLIHLKRQDVRNVTATLLG